MSSSAVFHQLIFGAAIAGFSIVLIAAVLLAIFFRTVVLKDEPDGQPELPTPVLNIGDLGMAGAFLFGILLIQTLGDTTPISTRYFLGFLISVVAIATTQIYDIVKTQSSMVRASGKIVAIAIAMGAGIVIDEFHLPWIGWVAGGWWVYPLTLFWILGLTGTYEAMDDPGASDSTTAVIASAFLIYVSYRQESAFTYLCSIALFSASFGFLTFNWLSEKLYMGQIGRVFLGFSFAVISIIAARYDRSHTSLLIVPLLLFHYIFDVAFTQIARLLNAKAVPFEKTAYLCQLLRRVGYTHRTVTIVHSMMALSQGIGAIAMIDIAGSNRVLIFLPYLLIQFIYAFWVLSAARAAKESENTPSTHMQRN